jgi:PPOX class probable F420-dependent enzyme
LGHLVTINPDGRPQVTCVWATVEGEDLLTAHLNPNLRKLQNVRREPRLAVSFEGSEIQPPGLRQYVVVHGVARIEEGGAPELLQELARVDLGPEAVSGDGRPAVGRPTSDRRRAGRRHRPLGVRRERLMGFEPTTFCMASRRSSQLSYSRAEAQV